MKWSSDVAPPLAGGKKASAAVWLRVSLSFLCFSFFLVEGEAVVDCSYFIRFLFLFL